MSAPPTVPKDAPEAYRNFFDTYPDVARAYQDMGKALRATGPLSEREVGLVKLAIAIGARMEGAAHSHTRRGLAAGIEEKALEQVAILAASTVGFPNMMAAFRWVRDVIEKR
jgi:4-carboxymuconolactone decarboxylase